MFLISNRLSEHRAETPEGYLLCTGCVIAATGAFPYKPSEVAGVAPGPDGLIHIRREPEDLFSPEAMASFEGKPVVFGHGHFADPENWGKIAKGIVQNVRRGSGEDFDKLIADLLITDSEAIAAVKAGILKSYLADMTRLSRTLAAGMPVTLGLWETTLRLSNAPVSAGRAALEILNPC